MRETIDIDGHETLIQSFIQRFGFMPEHNLEYFKYLTEEGVPAFAYNDRFAVLFYITAEGKSKVARTLVEPLADDKLGAIAFFVEHYLLEKGFDKVVLETRHEVREELVKRFKDSKFRVQAERYHLDWPVFILANFDETLAGGKWKKIRYFKNKFFKDHNAVVDDFKESDKPALKALIINWKKKRTATDRADHQRYLNMVENNFKGFDMAKVIRINNKAVSVFGGWKIPNSKNYYSCIGIYDYDIENIGEVSNVIDLALIKAAGFEKADLGGGEEALTNFKKKFFPDEFYRTDLYAVVKK